MVAPFFVVDRKFTAAARTYGHTGQYAFVLQDLDFAALEAFRARKVFWGPVCPVHVDASGICPEFVRGTRQAA